MSDIVERLEMYDPGSAAVQKMADAFAAEQPGELTSAQMQTVAFALRALHRNPDWTDGFIACAYLMSGRYQDYVKERNAMKRLAAWIPASARAPLRLPLPTIKD